MKLTPSLSTALVSQALAVRVRGTVQGVGFRPTVYRLARDCGLRGSVRNDGEGVLIHISGEGSAIAQFVDHLPQVCPPLAQITALETQPLDPAQITETDFRIITSLDSQVHTAISADAATCPDCLAEVFDPRSRYYRYPFTNCTHCGPRLSLVDAIPYDRAHTSMARFALCPTCQGEYTDVTNRRFHAQPVACPACGPQVWLENRAGQRLDPAVLGAEDAIAAAATLIQQGAIVAVKGLGGIHLACDATQAEAVAALRQRKHRDHKPLALMVRDVAAIAPYCTVSPLEQQLLESTTAPIVLLRRKTSAPALAPTLAPELNTLGVMLPYTPLHHLLMADLPGPVVLTSGNPSEEPQCIDNGAARKQLRGIADYFLLHDRDILNRVDDSVARIVGNQPQVLRRGRGYAPSPLPLPPGFAAAPPLLALGGELKTTVCLLQDGQAVMSQHLGDLENAAAYQAYQATLERYCQLWQHTPTAIAIDHHPEYLSTKLGQQLAQQQGLPRYEVQHHHAHVAACLADNGVPLTTAPVLGIALDGLGYGSDGILWGGEFLIADYREFWRLACLKPVAMLGGVQAVYQPWRNTYTHLMAAFGGNWQAVRQAHDDLELVWFLEGKPRSLFDQMLAQGLNVPLASSAGRLFDAVAAAMGLCRERVSYEGQAAMTLEALVDEAALAAAAASAYPLAVVPATAATANGMDPVLSVLDPTPLWRSLLQDLHQQTSPALMAARFHLGLAQAIADLASQLAQQHDLDQVALTGGVFQNRVLAQAVQAHLEGGGLTVLTHHQVPPNDGGLSLGQAAIAAARMLSPPACSV